MSTPVLTGIGAVEASRRLVRDGPITVPAAPPATLTGRVAVQRRDPMIVLLGGALAVVLALGELFDTRTVTAVVVLNTTIRVG